MPRRVRSKTASQRKRQNHQRLSFEPLESRRLLAVTVATESFQQAVFDSTGSFSGSTRIYYPDDPAYRDDYSGTSNAIVMLDYSSPLNGAGSGSSSGSGSGIENYAPRASDLDSYAFTYVGSGALNDTGGNLERIHASGTVTYDDGSSAGRAVNGNYSTGSFNISSLPFTANLSWNEPVDDGFGTGTTSGSWSGTLTSVDTTPFDIAVTNHFISIDESDLVFVVDKAGPPQPSPSHATPISDIRLYYSSTEFISGISSSAFENPLPIYWNHDELFGELPKSELDPSLGPYLLIVADEASGEADFGNNIRPVLLGPDLRIDALDANYYQVDGQKFANLTVTVKNIGLLDSDPTQLNIKAGTDRFDLSGFDIIDIGLPGIDVDASFTVNLPAVPVDGIPDDSRYLIAHADDPDTVPELDELNNSRGSEIPAEFTPSDLDVDAPGFAYTTYRIMNGILGIEPFTDALELLVDTTITNTGYKTSEPAEIIVYVDSEPIFDPNRSTYRELAVQSIPELDRNESVSLTFEEVQNPLEFPDDPNTGLPIYDSGYYIGVATDVADLSIFSGTEVEFSDADNLQFEDGCTTASTSHSILSLLGDQFAYLNPLGFARGGTNYAQRHLRHFLANSGAPLEYAANTDVANYLAGSSEFASTIQRSQDQLENEIIAELRTNGLGNASGTITRSFDLSGPHVAFGLLGSSNDLITGSEMAVAFGGFQSTQVQVTADYDLISRPVDSGTSRVYLDVQEAVFTITVGDKYTFDVSDIRKSPFDVMGRYTQMCGLSKAFDTSITTSVVRNSADFGGRYIGRFDSLDATSSLNLANGVAPESSLRFSQIAGGTTASWAPAFNSELQTIELSFTPHADLPGPATATHSFEVFADDGIAEQSLWISDLSDFTFSASSDILGYSSGQQTFSIPVPDDLYSEGTSYQLGFRLLTDNISTEQVELTLQELSVQQRSSRLGVSAADGPNVRTSFQFGPDSNATDTLPLLIRNDGDAAVTIEAIDIEGDFALVTPPTTPLTIAAQSSLPIEVRSTLATAGSGKLILSADSLFDGVLEVDLSVPTNSAPAFSPIAPLETNENEGGLVYALLATDAESPDQSLTYRLIFGPSDVTVSESGTLVWEPDDASAVRNEFVTVAVSDNGFPAMESQTTFELILNGPDRIAFAGARADGCVG